MLGLFGVLWRSWGGKKKPPTKEDVLCRSWRGEKKPPTKEDVVDVFLGCNLKACVGPMWGQVGAVVGYRGLMFGKLGPCGWHLAFHGGLV